MLKQSFNVIEFFVFNNISFFKFFVNATKQLIVNVLLYILTITINV